MASSLRRFITIFACAAAIAASIAPRAIAAESAEKERNFYEVLEDVMGDFEYDLKNGNVQGLRNLSIRNIALSENVPASFKSHLELLVTERIIKTSKTKVIQCMPCRARRTMMQGDQVVITSPENNPAELSRISKENGIEHFMDLAFSFQPSGIVLSMYITEPETGSVIFSRSYNSETSRASAFRRGVDYTQIDDARKMTEYAPTVQYRLALLYLFEPNGGGTTGTLGVGLRAVERYDNRRKEVGFELDYLKSSSTFAGSSSSSSSTTSDSGDTTTSSVNLYSGLNLTLLFVHGWNFIGEEENFNKMRGGLVLGLGGTYASGFLGGLVRAQYEWRLGKSYSVNATLGYRPAATAFLNGSAAEEVGGPEFGIGIGMFF